MRNGKWFLGSAVAAVACLMQVGTASAVLVDDFSSGVLTSYTQTKVLDQGAGTSNVSFSASTGGLQSISTGTTGAEQVLLLRSDFSLGINQQLRADVTGFGTARNQDLGIAVAATATPTGLGNGVAGDTRANNPRYIYSGIRTDAGHYAASGFDAAGLALLQDQTNNANPITSLFITRTGASTFEVGFKKDAGDVVAGTFTMTGTTTGTAIGFYTDMRADNTIGTFDNLTITNVPEPTSLALLGLGGLAALRRRRA